MNQGNRERKNGWKRKTRQGTVSVQVNILKNIYISNFLCETVKRERKI